MTWIFCCRLYGTLVLVVFLFAGVPAQFTAARAQATVARDARLGGDDNRTRFVADLSSSVPFRVFMLARPYRVIVDLPEVRFQFPSRLGEQGRGLVTAYRYGRFASGKSRIVIDVKAPVLIDRSFVINPQNGQPARLVIDLVRTDAGTFARTLEKQKRVPGRDKTAKAEDKVALAMLVPLPERGLRPALKAVSGKRRMIIIDPGHGGVDPGTIGLYSVEKDIVLAFARTLKTEIEAGRRYKVLLTREIDTFIPLRERILFAQKHGGDLFLSVHADSLPKNSKQRNTIRGATIYTISEEASDEEAKELAAKENQSDIIAGIDLPRTSDDEVTGILIDLLQRETKNHSVVFANGLRLKLKNTIRLNNKPLRSANFMVLKAPQIPSVLLELGYLSNRHDEDVLRTAKKRRQIARAVSQAVDRFFSRSVAPPPF